jgi:hypothetical protein
MAYIGQDPVIGRYIIVDQISGGFNGTASGFTLAAGGQGVIPGLAQNVLLSLGGVIQQPGTDYTVSGSGITFTTPPLSGTTFFATVLGDVQAVGTPSDGTVLPASIATSGTFVFPNITTTGTTLIASGNASTPSLAVIGDTNTGLYSPGADQLSITTGGTERFRIDSAGQLEAVSLGTAAAPTFSFTTDPNTGIYSPGADQVAISTAGSGRLFINSSGQVGVGASPTQLFQVGAFGGSDSNLQFAASTTGASNILFGDGSSGADFYRGFIKYNHATDSLELFASSYSTITTNGSERLRVDSSGRLLVGTSSARTIGTGNFHIQSEGSGSIVGISTTRNDNNTAGSNLRFVKTRGTAAGSTTIVQSGDDLGNVSWWGTDGTNAVEAAAITATVDGTPGANDMPGRLVFSTTSDGASSPTERLRITSAGRVGIGTSSPGATLDIIPAGSNVPFRITSNDSGVVYKSGSAAIKRFQLFFQDNSGTQTAKIGADISGVNASNLQFVAGSGATPQVTLNSSGQVGIGTTSPSEYLHVSGGLVRLEDGASGSVIRFYKSSAQTAFISNRSFGFHDGNGLALQTSTADPIRFAINDSEAVRIDSSKRLLVGTSSARSNLYNNSSGVAPQIQLEGTSFVTSSMMLVRNSADGNDTSIILGKTRGTSPGANTLVSNGDGVGSISFQGADGSELVELASIQAIIDGAPGANDMPGRLVFSTTADGASSPTERMRINSDGAITFQNAGVSLSSGVGFKYNANATNPNLGLVIDSNDGNTSHIHLYNINATNNAYRFYVKSNGGISNFSANNVNLSDRSVKKDIAPAADTWNCLKEWEVVNYRYKDQPDDADLNLGVIAQQVAESCPEVITVFSEATEDEPEKLGIKEQQMYWMAIKALQEAQVRIEALEADVAQLKGA